MPKHTYRLTLPKLYPPGTPPTDRNGHYLDADTIEQAFSLFIPWAITERLMKPGDPIDWELWR